MERFVLDIHDAIKRGKHWDLRFKLPDSNNWASFSMNKFPPSKPGEKIYIPRSNDHSESEALFLGKIPEGSYGAGKISRVDQGECIVHKNSSVHIVVEFKGKKLKGIYHLINTSVFGRRRKGSRVYSFFKGKVNTNESIHPEELEEWISTSITTNNTIEKKDVEKTRTSNKFIYLYHGTRAPNDILKREGLRTELANRYGWDEEEKYGNYISFTSYKKYAKYYTIGIFKKTEVVICKLETKFLKFAYNEKNADEYIYFKDIQPQDIIFPDQREYKLIERRESYLINGDK